MDRLIKTEILTTTVNITVKGENIPTELIVLKNARGNRTLLGVDFLSKAGIVLDLQKRHWYFSAYPERKYNFIESPPDINALLAVHTASNPCQLRENGGTSLSSQQKVKLNSLLEEYENCFQPGENQHLSSNTKSIQAIIFQLRYHLTDCFLLDKKS
ncbi:hypothetical protein AVEN_165678-1 [Araneus ventricosus]|uniref:Uncharacterized protein n=1 Tax=Araneus ventricosus TaxID=182803 RepID=A0A4Y2C3V6_ARAVE|nr:hypothetical protein AVEN_165678-1 [Araneus ventricosus]